MSRPPPQASRRAVLGASLLSSLGWLLTPRAGRAERPAAEPLRGGPVLVCVFLRGAADGLNVVVPHADEEYYRIRPTIAVPRPGQKAGAVDLDGRFGLHPELARLKPAYDAGELALIHAIGSPHPTRSHFEAQDYMETGAVGDRSVTQGWLARYLTSQPAPGHGPLRAVALATRSPLALRGYPDAIATPSLHGLRIDGGAGLSPVLERGFRRLYAEQGDKPAGRATQRALDTSQLVERALRREKNRARYPKDARSFAELARLIKADVGVETAWLNVGGWDTHRRQSGDLSRLLDRLGGALAAFRADLGAAFERVVVVVMTEFGRTARENGTAGTDHGHGSAMLVMGGKVKGGRVLGDFPGLAPDQLHQGRDLAVTTDFRDLLAELGEAHLGLTDAAPLFPGYRLERRRRLGVLG